MAAGGRQEAAPRAVDRCPPSSAAARPLGADSWLAAPPFHPRALQPPPRQSSLLSPAWGPRLPQSPLWNRQVAGSNHGSAMAPPAAGTPWPLLEPDVTCGNGQNGLYPKQEGDATYVLHTKLPLTVADPYGGCPIRLFPKVAAIHMDKVLFLLCSRDGAVPTKCYVYSPHPQKPIVQLPANVLPETLSPQSMGIMNSTDGEIFSYQVAHLWLKADTSGQLAGSLYRCRYSADGKKGVPSAVGFPHSRGVWGRVYSTDGKWLEMHDQVTLPGLPLDKYRNKMWHTHRVISLDGIGLLWIDLNQGLLLLRLDSEDPIFDFIPLPQIRNNPQRNLRTEACRSVGSCNGTVKLVTLNHSPGSDKTEVNIWKLTYEPKGKLMWEWEKENMLQHTPPLAYSLPCFPILSNDNSCILYLTMPSEDENEDALLLQFDVQTNTLKGSTVYPGYRGHKKSLFPVNLNLLRPAG